METSPAESREVAVPASVFAVLRRELAKEAGPLPTIHALHAAGYEAGAGVARRFAEGQPDGPQTLAAPVFWNRLRGFLDRRGWGSLDHTPTHPGVGLLSSSDWAEASGTEFNPDASCSFTTGFLSGLLTSLAGGPIAVLEVRCRGRGDDTCDFAFGSAAAIHELYGNLLEESSLGDALARL